MDSKNVQKTRFYACLKTKSLYTVIEKMLKTHLKGLCLFVSQQTKIIMLFKIDRFIGRPLDFLILDIYKCPKMDSTRLSFLGWLKNNLFVSKIIFKAFVVRELNCFKMLFFRKNQKNPKKADFHQKQLRHLWDVSKRLHKIDNEKKRDPFLVESWKNTFPLHTKNFLHGF